MTKTKIKPYSKGLKQLMAEKTAILSKAQGFADMGMTEVAASLWTSAAEHEERIAPLLEALGRELEAALHRVSAASCYQKSGNLSRAVNLYRAALSGPLRQETQLEVRLLLEECLALLTATPGKPVGQRRLAEVEA